MSLKPYLSPLPSPASVNLGREKGRLMHVGPLHERAREAGLIDKTALKFKDGGRVAAVKFGLIYGRRDGGEGDKGRGGKENEKVFQDSTNSLVSQEKGGGVHKRITGRLGGSSRRKVRRS